MLYALHIQTKTYSSFACSDVGDDVNNNWLGYIQRQQEGCSLWVSLGVWSSVGTGCPVSQSSQPASSTGCNTLTGVGNTHNKTRCIIFYLLHDIMA